MAHPLPSDQLVQDEGYYEFLVQTVAGALDLESNLIWLDEHDMAQAVDAVRRQLQSLLDTELLHQMSWIPESVPAYG